MWLISVLSLLSFVLISIKSNFVEDSLNNNYELNTANYFFRNHVIDMVDYYNELTACDGSNKPMICKRKTNDYIRKQKVSWTRNDQELDCKYIISSPTFNLSNESYNNIIFTLNINQINCPPLKSFKLLGGTSFHSFAYSDNQLVTCNSHDYLNQKYQISCKFTSILPINNISNIKSCIYLTIILLYEHFDSYSELLYDWTASYPPKLRSIVNNQSYCYDTNSFVNISSKISNTSNNFKLSNEINWFSGYWFINQVNHRSTYDNLHNTASNYNSELDMTIELMPDSAGYVKYWNTSIISTNISNNFEFQPIIYNLNTNSLQILNNIQSNLIRNITSNSMIYNFLGSSHMRYTYDFIVDYYKISNNNNRKHETLEIG